MHETLIHPNIVTIYSSVIQPIDEEVMVEVGDGHRLVTSVSKYHSLFVNHVQVFSEQYHFVHCT